MSGPRPGDSCSLRSVAAPVGGMWAVLVGAGGKGGGGRGHVGGADYAGVKEEKASLYVMIIV